MIGRVGGRGTGRQRKGWKGRKGESERDRGREIEGVERKGNWETEEGMKGGGEGERQRDRDRGSGEEEELGDRGREGETEGER